MTILRVLLRKLQEYLLPERSSDGIAEYAEPVDVLLAVHQRISRLAEQIKSHAELAPYPQTAEQLRQIAQEKHEIGHRLGRLIETVYGLTPNGSLPPVSGKNHWQRLIRDLEDQRDVDNVLARYEFTLIPEVPGIPDFLDRIKILHNRHRKTLIELIALADPQASQT